MKNSLPPHLSLKKSLIHPFIQPPPTDIKQSFNKFYCTNLCGFWFLQYTNGISIILSIYIGASLVWL